MASPCYQFHIHFSRGETVSRTKDVELHGAPGTDPPCNKSANTAHGVLYQKFRQLEITADKRFRSLILELENFPE